MEIDLRRDLWSEFYYSVSPRKNLLEANPPEFKRFREGTFLFILRTVHYLKEWGGILNDCSAVEGLLLMFAMH